MPGALAIWLNDIHIATVERRDVRSSVQKADRVSAERIVNEAATWGMRREHAQTIVLDVLHLLPDAIVSAAEQTAHVPEALVQLVSARTDRLREGS